MSITDFRRRSDAISTGKNDIFKTNVIDKHRSKTDAIRPDDNTIEVALTITQEEGVDVLEILSYTSDSCFTGEVLEINSYNYLLVDKAVNSFIGDIITKFTALECNVLANIRGIQINGSYKGDMKSENKSDYEKSTVVDKDSIVYASLVVSSITDVDFGDKITINGAGNSYEIVSIDSISANGIKYLTVRRVSLGSNYIGPSENVDLDSNELIQGSTVEISTNFGFATFNKTTTITKRLSNTVEFIVPIGIDLMTIEKKNAGGDLISTQYDIIKVV